MDTHSFEKLNSHIQIGKVYRRETLSHFSKAIDRDLDTLVNKGLILKLSAGLYYKPKKSAFGILPPNESDLVRSFLKDSNFLIYSWHHYNGLGLGLTQLYNRIIVLNHKRCGILKLGNKEFDFRRPNNGFPSQLTKEFLLIDLINNLNELAEDTHLIMEKIKFELYRFDRKKIFSMAKKYGKVRTKHFFAELEKKHVSSSTA